MSRKSSLRTTLAASRRTLIAGAALAALAAAAHAKPQADGRLGLGLRELVAFQAGHAQAEGAALRAAVAADFSRAGFAVLDESGRVRVNVHLDGRASMAALKQAVEALGGHVMAENMRYRHGVFTASLPINKARALADVAGVRSILLAPPPVADVGKTTSQGAAVLKTDVLNAQGLNGSGITVGILSDSYNTATNTNIKAAQDIASGDLPGPGNPNGYTTPVAVLFDQPGGTDEGRGMAQIVHDLAPAAKLCFATAYSSEVDFANHILALADPNGACAADVIVDDIIYFAEPMFSDGVVAQAVDDVAAQGISYFSSAGNRGSNQAYLAGFRKVPNNTARSGGQSVNLALIPSADTQGGFHNLVASGSGIDVSRTITVSGSTNTFVFQWNDPYDSGGITTDYDLYVYNAAGTALVASSTDDNRATDQPIEAVQLPPGTYQLVVARADASPAQPVADQIRFITFGTVLSGEYLDFATPGTYGHNSANGAMGTAALGWFQPYLPESFTSLGKGTFYFDRDGNRLANPQIRNKPDIAAPDGVNTTFFPVGGDSAEDTDTYPNFFGTSAAAPHAAGVAALMLQKSGGPGSIAPTAMRTLLQSTAVPHDGTANVAQARVAQGPASLTVTGTGDGNNWSGINPNAFRVAVDAPAGYSLATLTIDLTNANTDRVLLGTAIPGLQFDPRVSGGYPITLGDLTGLTAADVTFSSLSSVPPFSKTLTMTFAPGKFTGGKVLQFGVDRDEVALGAGGNAMDLLIGGEIRGTAKTPAGQTVQFRAKFANTKFGNLYQVQSGYGLIDAVKAAQNAP